MAALHGQLVCLFVDELLSAQVLAFEIVDPERLVEVHGRPFR